MTQATAHDAATLLPTLAQSLHSFFSHLDARRYEALLQYFTPHARWLRQGKWLQGRPAIAQALDERTADIQTCHVMSNTFVAACKTGEATVESYMTAYRYPTPAEPGCTPTIAGALRVNHVITVFQQQADGAWRIAEQRLIPLIDFKGA